MLARFYANSTTAHAYLVDGEEAVRYEVGEDAHDQQWTGVEVPFSVILNSAKSLLQALSHRTRTMKQSVATTPVHAVTTTLARNRMRSPTVLMLLT